MKPRSEQEEQLEDEIEKHGKNIKRQITNKDQETIQETNTPFIKKGLFKKQFEKTTEDKKPKEPLLFLIKGDNTIQIYEGVKEGPLEIDRGNEKAEITLPNSKLLTANWGSDTLRLWIADEKEAIALPTRVLHDSLELKRKIDAIIANYKSYHTKGLELGGTVMLIGAILIIGALIYFGIIPLIFPQHAAITQAVTNGIKDVNLMDINKLGGITHVG